MDDVRKEFSGWSDPELSPQGKLIAKNAASDFIKNNFDIILTSPLERAKQSASIIGKVLDINYEEFVYLKERNTYGLLGGLSKVFARDKYPKLVKAYNAQHFIPGSERYSDFKSRVDLLLSKLTKMKYESILCVTHGYLITTIMEEFLGMNREDIEDGCFLGLKVTNGKLEYFESKGLTFSEGEGSYDSERYRKFK
jgi:broad specificity phosphatase PhoE